MLPLGSIADNLISPAHTFVVCLGLLGDLDSKSASKYQNRSFYKSIEKNEELSLFQTYQLKRAIGSITCELNKYVPPFTYFGYHPTDRFNLGVWIDLGLLHAAEQNGKLTQVIVDKHTSWQGIKSNYILEISSEGLVLYKRKTKQTIWKTK